MLQSVSQCLLISIHALCEEGDPTLSMYKTVPYDFYPRPLRGGRHRSAGGGANRHNISIHALCEEGDP